MDATSFSRSHPVIRLIVSVLIALIGLGSADAAAPDDAIARQGFQTASVGYVLFRLDTGAVVEERQADRPFIPASVAKLPTVAAALKVLGPDHRFTTRLHAIGPIQNGVLRGDLILEGGGDPSLSSEGLTQLVAGLQASAITRVTGRFVYDAGHGPELSEIDSGQPWAAPYNTGVGALAVNFNRAQLAWTRGASGAVTVGLWSVSDSGRTPLDSATVSLAPNGAIPPLPNGPDRWLLPQKPNGNGRLWLPVARPGLAAASLFRRLAADAGVSLPAPQPGRVPPDKAAGGARVVATLDSPPLTAMARALLRYSNNLSAEMIGLAAARRIDPTIDRLGQSALLLQTLLTRQSDAEAEANAKPADWRGLRLANHSGLGTGSQATPRQMAALLRLGGPPLWSLLPGEEDGKALPPGVHAKTGTLSFVKGLAGAVRTASGQTLGFALFITDAERRRALDAALDRRVTEPPAEAHAWAIRARALQNDLLTDWIGRF
jgi:serine-type D-Ala-D-Ala carboxypeptidase/endopeptidase (penicillin-binding protein 4)